MAIENDLPPVNSHPLHQHDDSDCSIMAPITKDELYQELDELLTAFCSDAQQQFCVDQNVIELDDLERIRQTVQQVQTLLPTVDRNNNLQLRRALARAIHDILQHYGNACQQRNMRVLDEILTNQYIGDWHRLKLQWELRARENQHILLILDDITLLTQSWLHHQNNTTSNNKNLVPLPSLSSLPHRLSTAKKRASHSGTSHKTVKFTSSTMSAKPLSSASSTLLQSSSSAAAASSSSTSSTAADILASILTTFDYPRGAYTVIIDKHNYGQLGLQHGKIGTRQIIFDTHQLSSSEIIETVNQICDIFASLFASTAHHHLAQIDAQVRKSQPFYTMTHIKRLSARIFDRDATAAPISEDADLEYEERREVDDISTTTPFQHHRRHSSASDTASSSYISTLRLISIPSALSPSQSPASSSLSSSMAVLTPFRLSMTAPHMLWHHPIPIPSFAPAPWQLPDLLKPRHPYNPLFFGLFRRRASITSTATTNINSNSNRAKQHQQHQQHQEHQQQHQQQPYSFLKHTQSQHHHRHHHHHRDQLGSMPTKTTSAVRGKNTGYQHHHSTTASAPNTPKASTSSSAPNATTTTTNTDYYARINAPDTYANIEGHAASPDDEDDNNDNGNTTTSNRGYQPSSRMTMSHQPRPSTSSHVQQRHSSTFDRTRHFVSRAIHGGGGGGGGTLDGGKNDDYDNYYEGDNGDVTSWNESIWRHSKSATVATATAAAAAAAAPFTSISVDKLSFHLGKIAGQFYQDLLMHTRLRYQETQSGLESLEWQMMDLYRHLQLASSRAVMQRAMMIVQELDDHDNNQLQQEHYAYGQQQPAEGYPDNHHRHHNNNSSNTRQYGEDDDTNTSNSNSSSSSSDSSGGQGGCGGDLYGQHQQQSSSHHHWTPICTDSSTAPPPLVYHSGTTTATSASSASQQALRPSCTGELVPSLLNDDNDNEDHPISTSGYSKATTAASAPVGSAALVSTNSGHSSLLAIDKQQMQQQKNNPALSITSSFTTAAS